MWSRFTTAARRCVVYAQWEAERCGARFVCSEHLLLGLCREAVSAPGSPPGKPPTLAERLRRLITPAERFIERPNERPNEREAALTALEPGSSLARLGLDWRGMRAHVERGMLCGVGAGGDMQLSRRGRRILELAYDEARQAGHAGIAPEHLLLGILREGEGTGAKTLLRMGVELETLRRWIREPQSGVLLRSAGNPVTSEELLRPARHENDTGIKLLLLPVPVEKQQKGQK